MPRPPRIACAFLAALTLASCVDGDDEDPGPGTTAPPATTDAPAEFLATVQADQFTGEVNQPFQLSALLDGTLAGPLSYAWDLGSAGTSTQEMVDVQFDTAGIKPISVVVSETTGELRSSEASTVLVVLDPAAPVGLFNEPLPALPGDLDDNGQLDLRDGLALSQHLANLSRIEDPDELDLADFDRDGIVGALDLDLLSRAIVEGQAVPRALTPNQAMPGQVVTLFSPALLSTTGTFEVRVGDAAPFEPIRVVPGQISFFLPLDVLSAGTFTTLGGDTMVDLLSESAVVDSLPLQVLDAPTLPGNLLAEVDQLFNMLPGARAGLLASLDGFLGSAEAAALGYDAGDRAVLCALLEESNSRLNDLNATLADALSGLGTMEKEFAVRIAYANGFGEAYAALQGMASNPALSGPAAGSSLSQGGLFALCELERSAQALASANEATGYLCAGLGALFLASLGASVIYPGALVISAEALAAFEGCAAALAASEVAELVLDLVPDLGDELLLTPEGTPVIGPGETLAITPSIRLTGLDDLCEKFAGAGSDELFEELLAEPITEVLLHKFPLRPIFNLVHRVSPAAADELEEVVEDVVEAILGTTPLPGYIENLAGDLCGLVGNIGAAVPVDPTLVTLTANPDLGTVGVSGDNLTYTCPVDPGSNDDPIELTGELLVCDGTVDGQLTVTCGEEVEVTIRMGDNGQLLDDIFEVVVNGQSVLTSSVPVTSTQTTILLSTGMHQLQMNGLAAPDGVGTYFIQVSGGTLLNGPPLTGTNLVAGATFNWDLLVQQP